MTDFNKISEIQKIIQDMLSFFNFKKTDVNYEESIIKGLVFNINCGGESYMLIGRQGSTLRAFQVLCGQIAEKKLKEPTWFTIDVDDYKMKREWFLKETARAAVEHIKKTGRAAALEPMPAFERRFVHAFLQDNFPEAESTSLGRDPYRQVVIRLKR